MPCYEYTTVIVFSSSRYTCPSAKGRRFSLSRAEASLSTNLNETAMAAESWTGIRVGEYGGWVKSAKWMGVSNSVKSGDERRYIDCSSEAQVEEIECRSENSGWMMAGGMRENQRETGASQSKSPRGGRSDRP